MSTKRVGQLLKEAREELKLSVRDVSKETNIAVKFILALENEDYAQFPAETFTIGFLKTYADYLKLETASIINMYRGEQMADSPQPIEELTRPTVKMIALQLEKNKAIPILIIVGIIILVFLVYYIYDSAGNESSDGVKDETQIENVVKENSSSIPTEMSFISQSVPERASVPFVLTQEQGFLFSVNNQQCKIFIKSVKKVNDENVAIIGFNIFPEKKVYSFESKVGDETILSYNNPELSSLRREIKVVTQAVNEKSAKVLIKLSDEKAGSTKKPVGDIPIQVTLNFVKSSYVEFVIDGQPGERGLISSGETRLLEAKDRLEIKVGDGGAVEISQNGKEKTKMGRSGKQIKRVFYKAQNSFDNTQYIIKELGE